MRRYNLGFLKFGPLEECNNGELMYYSDHHMLMENKEKLISEYSADYHKIYDLYENMNIKKDVYKAVACLSIIANFTLLAISLSLYFHI